MCVSIFFSCVLILKECFKNKNIKGKKKKIFLDHPAHDPPVFLALVVRLWVSDEYIKLIIILFFSLSLSSCCRYICVKRIITVQHRIYLLEC